MARLVEADAVRSAVASAWFFTVDATYRLFELSVERAVLGRRSADEWPPRYASWSAAAPGR